MKFDFRNLAAPRLAKGLSVADLSASNAKAAAVKQQFLTDRAKLDFVKILAEKEALTTAVKQITELASKLRAVCIVGIGGSDLAARAIFKALNHSQHNLLVQQGKLSAKQIFFLGDTTDPVVLAETLASLDLGSTLFLIVSKSGNTIEQASTFIWLRDRVKQALGAEAVTRQFVLLTDASSGTLRELANKQGYQTIDHPEVGGRFSALSAVGMVPAHLMGLRVEEFLGGANALAHELDSANYEVDQALIYAQWHYLYAQQGKGITVMMPYLYSLREFALWFRQLWAESLGKRLNLQGEEIYAGLTPIAALGPTDQHSQLQLYNEGPNDKLFTLITTEKSRQDLTLPTDFSGVEAFNYLQGRSLHEVLNLELETTAFALTKNQRPNCKITLPILDEYNLGQLFYFYELVTAYLGYFLEINVYDQPGVELSKNAMFGVLGKPGYETNKAEFEHYLNN